VTETEVLSVFVQLLLLLLAAHAGGALLARARQPRVIGELLGGFVLGPSVFGALLPQAQLAVFPLDATSTAVLGFVYQAGLLSLLFVTGTHLVVPLRSGERRLAGLLAAVGAGVPFLVGLATFALWDADGIIGAARSHDALVLVFASALAVTSIPVVSRIFLDLGLMETRLARVVISTALVEDIAVYAVLAVALGLALDGADRPGLPGALGLQPDTLLASAFYTTTSLAVVLGAFAARRSPSATRLAQRASATTSTTVLCVLAIACGCLLLGLPLLIGGLVSGIALARPAQASEVERALAPAAMSTLVPLYFAIVGYRIDLGSAFDPLFTCAFIALACSVKASSIYVTARLASEPRASATDLAVALNARGGPGIVLASVALDAAIISRSFYVSMILLAVGSSMAAGTWLERRAGALRERLAPHWRGREADRLRAESGAGVVSGSQGV
jgi:Kef-type K+ transport system membrane component KefB